MQTAIWTIGAMAAITYLTAMTLAGALPRSRQLVQYHEHGLLAAEPEQVSQVVIRTAEDRHTFRREGDHWLHANQAKNQDGQGVGATKLEGSAGDAGEKSDARALTTQQAATLERAIKFMHTSAPVRVFPAAEWQAGGLVQYGLDEPVFLIELAGTQGEMMRASFGTTNATSMLQYLSVTGRDELFLVSLFVGAEWSAVVAALAR